MTRIRKAGPPSPAMVVASIALVVALGGTGYAAIKLPANSVGTKQLRKNAVTGAKVKDFSLFANDFAAGQIPKGPPGANGANGAPGAPGAAGAKGDKGDPGTIPAVQAEQAVAAFANGWSAFDAARTPKYYKDPFGVVRLSGGLKGGTVALTDGPSNVAFTLPAGYRPDHTIYEWVLATNAANFSTLSVYLGVTTDGGVHVIGAAGSNGFVSLDGFTFRAAG